MADGKPKKRDFDDTREFKARLRAWKQEKKLIKKFAKKGLPPPDSSYLAQKRGEVPPPPPPIHERPIPKP